MLSFLRGKIIYKNQGFVIVDVRDVGYKVFVNSVNIVELKAGDEIEIFVYQYVREDILALYGFRSADELEIFELLLSISGVGPKSALGITAIASPDEIKQSIAAGDSTLLTKVSGIGKKTAERVVLELRDKIATLGISVGLPKSSEGMQVSADEIDALMALGYNLQQAREALKKVDPMFKTSGERIREALRKM